MTPNSSRHTWITLAALCLALGSTALWLQPRPQLAPETIATPSGHVPVALEHGAPSPSPSSAVVVTPAASADTAATEVTPADTAASVIAQNSLGEALFAARHEIRALSPAHAALPINARVTHFAANPSNDITARFLDRGGVRIASARHGAIWQAELRAVGSESPAEADGARAEFRHGDGATEWFENRAEGFEHGFTVPAPQGADGRLVYRVALSGLRAELDPDSAGDLRFTDEDGVARLGYRGLKVWDADGKALPAEMHPLPDGRGFEIVAMADSARYPVMIDPLIVTLEGTLRPAVDGDGTSESGAGSKVALSGTTAAITAAGNVYIFVRSAGQWALQARLPTSGSLDLDGDTLLVGTSVYRRVGTTWSLEATLPSPASSLVAVALDGDTVVLGDYDGAGQAHVYTRSGSVWTFQATLAASDPHPSLRLGWSVALSGDTCLLGCFPSGSSPPLPAAYVFTRSGAVWTQQQKLPGVYISPFNSDNSSNLFSHKVALSGDLAVVADSGKDRAHAYRRSGAVWTEEAQLTTADPDAPINFAESIAIDGTLVAVGAAQSFPTSSNPGAVYLFTREAGGSWLERAKLSAEVVEGSQAFGVAIAIDGASVLVGDPNGDARTGGGRASVYLNPAGIPDFEWVLDNDFGIGNAREESKFGSAVAIDGEVALIGAPNDDTPAAPNAGAAYVFVRAAGVWSNSGFLAAAAGVEYDQFGIAVALSGTRALVGAPANKSDGQFVLGSTLGGAYVFRFSAGNWVEEAALVSPGGTDATDFGSAVALTDTDALVGAPEEDSGGFTEAGGAHVFTRSGTSWTHATRLGALVPGESGHFGIDVALLGQSALIGSNDAANGCQLFQRSGGVWSVVASFTNPDDGFSWSFGAKLALGPDLVLVSEWAATGGGKVQVFHREGAAWVHEATLQPEASGGFGFDISLDGDLLLVGAPYFAAAGKAFLYRRGEVMGKGVWRPVTEWSAATDGEFFGSAVALDGDTVLIGDHLADGVALNAGDVDDQGAAYAYTVDDSEVLYFFPASPVGLLENSPVGTLAGAFSLGAQTAGLTFSLVGGAGSGQNGKFSISTNQLITATTEDYDALPATTFNFRARATGGAAGPIENTFQIELLDDRGEDADGDGLSEADEEDIYSTSDTDSDSDDDTLSDGIEVAAKLDPTVPNPELLAALAADPGAFGIDVGALTFGMPFIARDPTTGEITLRLRLRGSGDLENFVDLPFNQAGLSVLPDGTLQYTLPAPANRAFFTLEGE